MIGDLAAWAAAVPRRAKGRFTRLMADATCAPAAFRQGYPAGAPLEDLEFLAYRHLGTRTPRISHRRLSGWKQTGAFRLVFENGEGASWSLIYKDAIYDEEIVGLTGLSISPGPPEYAIYNSADAQLQSFLPRIYALQALSPGRHYRYLMEDLAAAYTNRRPEKLILALCEQLPGIHAAISPSFGTLKHDALLRFDRDFALNVLDYAHAGLARLSTGRRIRQLDAVLAVWSRLADTYVRVMENVYAEYGLHAIHGDLNRQNVLFHRHRPQRVKIIDWEWAGYGLPHADLVSLLKVFPAQVEARGLSAYERACGRSISTEARLSYQWCKLQRGMLDASFFARQMMDGSTDTNIDLRDSIEQALARAYRSFQTLENIRRSRSIFPFSRTGRLT